MGLPGKYTLLENHLHYSVTGRDYTQNGNYDAGNAVDHYKLFETESFSEYVNGGCKGKPPAYRAQEHTPKSGYYGDALCIFPRVYSYSGKESQNKEKRPRVCNCHKERLHKIFQMAFVCILLLYLLYRIGTVHLKSYKHYHNTSNKHYQRSVCREEILHK